MLPSDERLGNTSGALGDASDAASVLPYGNDLDFHGSINKDMHDSIVDISESLVSMLDMVSDWGDDGNAEEKESASTGTEPPHAPSASVSDNEEYVDTLLEGADTLIDEFTGVAPRRDAGSSSHAIGDALPKQGSLPAHIVNAPVPPPQRGFTTQPDNREGIAWTRPLRMGKPNALVPIGWTDTRPEDLDPIVRGPYGVEGNPKLNPYNFEIMNTPVPAAALKLPEAEAPPTIELGDAKASTPACTFEWVANAAALQRLLAHLMEVRVVEIAVDLEHHSVFSYQGITCLMQISTRWGDWVVDTLVDEVREGLESLNAAFTHPHKVMVLHGAEHDVLWMQRDFGLYMTNLFDTFHATHVLQHGAHSLAALLQRYVGFLPDKRYQRSDWRLRPLPREMLFYARSDTHSLLYVYDRLRADLHAYGGPRAVVEVFERSKGTATKAYAKETWDPVGTSRGGWHTMWLRSGGELANSAPGLRPLALMGLEERLTRALHHWRDGVARELDVSPGVVMSAQTAIQLALRVPTTELEVMRIVPAGSYMARSRAADIVATVAHEVQAYNANTGVRESAEDEVEDVAETSTQGNDTVPASSPPPEAPHVLPGTDPRLWHAQPGPSQQLEYAPMITWLAASSPPYEQPQAAAAPRSLFELPVRTGNRTLADSARTLRKLSLIRSACADAVSPLLGAPGGVPAEEVPVDEHASVSSVPEHGAAAPCGTERTVDKDEDGGASAVAHAQPDEVVKVSKKSHHSGKKRRDRKEKIAEVAPFNYEQSASVLETPPEPENKTLLTKAPKGKGKATASVNKRRATASDQSASTSDKRTASSSLRSAKQRSEKRTGNKSGTFSRGGSGAASRE